MLGPKCGSRKMENDYVLSAPEGCSINNHISGEKFFLQYSSVDDAIRMLTILGKGALMAKLDLKAAFRMVPVCSSITPTTSTPATHSDFVQPHIYSISFQRPYSGY